MEKMLTLKQIALSSNFVYQEDEVFTFLELLRVCRIFKF